MTTIEEISATIAQPETIPEAPQDENFLSQLENQAFPIIPFPTGGKKFHTPLQATSTQFIAKGLTTAPAFLQESCGSICDSTDVTHSSVVTESICVFNHVPLVEHLDLTTFKTKPCLMNTQHNHKHCSFYHNAKDRKRVGYFFSAELCEYAEKEVNNCPHGEDCNLAHNRVEQLYRPEKYKTKFCSYYPHNLEKCEYGNFCSFAHTENDIAITLIHNYDYDEDFYLFHFKTEWCPFNLTQHDKALCVYAHNWQDYRRKPNNFQYEPSPCPNWKSTDFITNYDDGCHYNEKCNKCHGWKEHEYHPLNYKTKPCPGSKNCQKGKDCPCYHNPKERRLINTHVQNRVFKFVPRNRIITNTFKIRSADRLDNAQAAPKVSSLLNTSLHQSPFKNQLDHDSFEHHDLLSELLHPPPKQNFVQSLTDLGTRMKAFSSQQGDKFLQVPSKASIDGDDDDNHFTSQTVNDIKSLCGIPAARERRHSLTKGSKQFSIGDTPKLNLANDQFFKEVVAPTFKIEQKAEMPIISETVENQFDAQTQAQPETETQTQPEIEKRIETQIQPEGQIQPESQIPPDSEVESQPKIEAQPETQTQAQAQPEPETQTESKKPLEDKNRGLEQKLRHDLLLDKIVEG
jgi:hypothetical protein